MRRTAITLLLALLALLAASAAHVGAASDADAIVHQQQPALSMKRRLLGADADEAKNVASAEDFADSIMASVRQSETTAHVTDRPNIHHGVLDAAYANGPSEQISNQDASQHQPASSLPRRLLTGGMGGGRFTDFADAGGATLAAAEDFADKTQESAEQGDTIAQYMSARTAAKGESVRGINLDARVAQAAQEMKAASEEAHSWYSMGGD
jgi:hypothetical protein